MPSPMPPPDALSLALKVLVMALSQAQKYPSSSRSSNRANKLHLYYFLTSDAYTQHCVLGRVLVMLPPELWAAVRE